MNDSVNPNALGDFLDGLRSRIGGRWTLAVTEMDGTIHHGGEEITEEELRKRKERYREKNGPLPTPSEIDFRLPSN
jgi:hypothetical protein